MILAQVLGEIVRDQTLLRQSAPLVEVLITLQKIFKRITQRKEIFCAAGASDNRQTEWKSRKTFRCGSEDHLIAKFPNPPKDNEKRKKQVRFNEKVNRACNNRENNSDQNIYASMARMSGNE